MTEQTVAIIGAIDAINRLTELNFDITKLARVTDHCPEWTAYPPDFVHLSFILPS